MPQILHDQLEQWRPQFAQHGFDFKKLHCTQLQDLAQELGLHASSQSGGKPLKHDWMWCIERHYAMERVRLGTQGEEYLRPDFNPSGRGRTVAYFRQIFARHDLRYLSNGKAIGHNSTTLPDLQAFFAEQIDEMRLEVHSASNTGTASSTEELADDLDAVHIGSSSSSQATSRGRKKPPVQERPPRGAAHWSRSPRHEFVPGDDSEDDELDGPRRSTPRRQDGTPRDLSQPQRWTSRQGARGSDGKRRTLMRGDDIDESNTDFGPSSPASNASKGSLIDLQSDEDYPGPRDQRQPHGHSRTCDRGSAQRESKAGRSAARTASNQRDSSEKAPCAPNTIEYDAPITNLHTRLTDHLVSTVFRNTKLAYDWINCDNLEQADEILRSSQVELDAQLRHPSGAIRPLLQTTPNPPTLDDEQQVQLRRQIARCTEAAINCVYLGDLPTAIRNLHTARARIEQWLSVE